MSIASCQVVGDVPQTCAARESGGLRCERTDPHGPEGHWISEHTIAHALAGTGYSCSAITPPSGQDSAYVDAQGHAYDEGGLPVHLPMPVNADGQGPLDSTEHPDHFVCWCADPDCVWTRALSEAQALIRPAAAEG